MAAVGGEGNHTRHIVLTHSFLARLTRLGARKFSQFASPVNIVEIDKNALGRYKELSTSFYNIPVEKVYLNISPSYSRGLDLVCRDQKSVV